jgi:hypothetical protein
MKRPAMPFEKTPAPKGFPKMMLGFVVRRCAIAVGHDPTAEEFAAWANQYRDGDRTVFLFGRPISIVEAQVILRHPGRPVTARSATPHERIAEEGVPNTSKVTSFAEARARLKARAK